MSHSEPGSKTGEDILEESCVRYRFPASKYELPRAEWVIPC
jgi:hypothetical protein